MPNQFIYTSYIVLEMKLLNKTNKQIVQKCFPYTKIVSLTHQSCIGSYIE